MGGELYGQQASASAEHLLPSKNVQVYNHGGNLDFSTMQLPRNIEQRVENSMRYPVAGTTQLTLCEDGNIHVSYYLVYGEKGTDVVLFVSNCKATNYYNNVTVQVEVPGNLEKVLMSVDGVDVLEGGFKVERLPPLSGVVELVGLGMSRVVLNTMVMKGRVSYQNDKKESQWLVFSLPLEIKEFVRPYNLTTKAFGENWKGLHMGSEKFEKSPSRFSGVDQAAKFLQGQLNLHHIQTLGQELIACGRVVDSRGGEGGEALVLVHFKLEPSKSTITVRTQDQVVSKAIVGFIGRLIV